jgi:hypothetical protein
MTFIYKFLWVLTFALTKSIIIAIVRLYFLIVPDYFRKWFKSRWILFFQIVLIGILVHKLIKSNFDVRLVRFLRSFWWWKIILRKQKLFFIGMIAFDILILIFIITNLLKACLPIIVFKIPKFLILLRFYFFLKILILIVFINIWIPSFFLELNGIIIIGDFELFCSFHCTRMFLIFLNLMLFILLF